jgi:flagellar biosynthesis chaperone FliJ
MILKIRLQNQLDELAELPPDERLEAQALYLKHAPVLDGQIRKLQEQWKKLDLLRREKLQQVLKTRKGRKGLERLRAGARLEFERQYHAQEQKELDENTHTALIRRRFEAAI